MLENFTAYLNIFLTALTPIGELRLAIPFGLTKYQIHPGLVYLIAVAGNMLPPLIILHFLPELSAWLRKNSTALDKFFTWLFERTRRKTEKQITKYGHLALVIFVAIPLPNTGAWTGALAAWLFGIPKRKAIRYIFYGVLIAGLIMTVGTLGMQNLF